MELSIPENLRPTPGGISIPRIERHAVREFGREYGMAYQMVDDYLDAETSCREQVMEQFDRARGCLHPLGERAMHLCEMLDYLNSKIQAGCQAH